MGSGTENPRGFSREPSRLKTLGMQGEEWAVTGRDGLLGSARKCLGGGDN